MNTKKIVKIISILFVIIAIFSAFNMVLGASIPSPSKPSGTGIASIENITGNVIFIIQMIAFAAAVIMLIFVGIKFITASPEGKAEIKKTAVIYVIGAVLLFAAGAILTILKNVVEQNIK